MTDDQIKQMTEQFLTWKLPEAFNPDAGISFDPVYNLGTEFQMRHKPTGTNLFTFEQAKSMVLHMVEGLTPTEFTADQLDCDPILRYFHYAHLPQFLQGASKPFGDLARYLVENLPRNAERSVALRKLLEAKDAAVRANVK